MQENLAAAKYEISRAVKADLVAITRIYNASVLERNATAALHPVDIEEREAWFDAHEAANRPIYVLREVCDANLTSREGETFEPDYERKFDSKRENLGAQKPSVTSPKGEILAWGSLSDYHPREGLPHHGRDQRLCRARRSRQGARRTASKFYTRKRA